MQKEETPCARRDLSLLPTVVRLPLPRGTVYPLDFLAISSYTKGMRNKETTMNLNQFALEATFALHNVIKDDEMFCGYESTKEQFDDLYDQVLWLVNNVIHTDCLDQENVIENWQDMQLGVINGEVESDWHRY